MTPRYRAVWSSRRLQVRIGTHIPLLTVALLLASCTAILTPMYGVREGQLAPCPSNRDCMSSSDTDPARYIAPLIYTGTRARASSDLLQAINAVGQARIVSNHRNYLRVEYPISNPAERAAQYYYQPANAVDDVEFYLVPERHVIEIRSIAQLGLFDVGANRARLEQIRSAFEKLQQQH
ncbi:MAG TPA: DUF1499 domain-containing protein [Gammaproteobacteria bacterium]|nr:DUF1499 domain-containing protein [Gammaproteobacteria bacterium]